MSRRARLAVAAAPAAALILAPAAAEAHGLVQRTNLPIPEWLFGWAAAIVLVASFAGLAVLWPAPRLQEPGWRPLPAGIGRVLGSRPVEWLCALIGVALLVVILLAGYIGRGSALDNLAPTFILIDFWVGLVFVSVLFGDVFRAFSPWRAIRLPGFRPYPERWGRYPAAIALLGFTWIELVSGWGDHPATLASAALGYTVYTLIDAGGLRDRDLDAATARAFAVYFNLFSRISVWETRDRVVGLRPPLGGLPRLDAVHRHGVLRHGDDRHGHVRRLQPGAAVEGPVGRRRAGDRRDRRARRRAEGRGDRRAARRGRRDRALLPARDRRRALGRRRARDAPSCGARSSTRSCRSRSSTSSPHYLTFLLFEGQATFYLASDPFGQGWDLFGTADRAIDYTYLSQNGAWYLQVAVVVIGHVCALILAHDRALALYRDTRLAVRSQYWMLAVMVGFTSLALWLLSQATV